MLNVLMHNTDVNNPSSSPLSPPDVNVVVVDQHMHGDDNESEVVLLLENVWTLMQERHAHLMTDGSKVSSGKIIAIRKRSSHREEDSQEGLLHFVVNCPMLFFNFVLRCSHVSIVARGLSW